MASTLKIDTVTTPDGTGNITFNRPINATQGGVGKILQIQYTTNTTYTAASDTAFPFDDTIPTISEGTNAGINVTITPANASNKLLIQGNFSGAHSGSGDLNSGLFITGTTDALVAWKTEADNSTGNHFDQIHIFHVMAAGTTSAIEFQFRVGPPSGGGTLYINGGQSTGRKYGGASTCIMSVTEISA
jgi:hypothetical protein